MEAKDLLNTGVWLLLLSVFLVNLLILGICVSKVDNSRLRLVKKTVNFDDQGTYHL
jgi:hypothetical protein